MAYPIATKKQAIKLRRSGYSIKEIAKTLNIAVGTSSIWLRNIKLSNTALFRLQTRVSIGHHNANEHRKQLANQRNAREQQQAVKFVRSNPLSTQQQKIVLAILFWTEGAKDTSLLSFSNSDPSMITTYLNLLRHTFPINECKLRALLHAHEYHNIPKQMKYWSKLTKIPLYQFHKTYLKPHTAKRKRLSYPGCLRVTYYDASIARELTAIYNAFAHKS